MTAKVKTYVSPLRFYSGAKIHIAGHVGGGGGGGGAGGREGGRERSARE